MILLNILISWFSNFIQWIVELDQQLFLLLNQKLTNPIFDVVMPFMRNSTNWILLYVLLIIFAFYKLKQKAFIWIFFAICTIVLTDQLSSHVIKPFIARVRPCNDINFSSQVRLLLANCSSGFSFTSSHACNHFGIAMFIFISLFTYLKKWAYLFILWAAIISYAQVYVGVHYPIDILFGGILGSTIGFFIGRYCKTKIYLKT
ncbi:MAG: phosphatase PAP2 family protein [Chitinophagaceae bacterium]|nr:phosphatase PAP2 family protein [Chitinophagaceae bacterium]